MRKLIFSLILMTSTLYNAVSQETTKVKRFEPVFEVDTNLVVTYAEVMPKYPGGDTAMLMFVAENVEYPAIAKENGITGVVYVGFVVDVDGSVKNVHIKRGADPFLDRESARIIASISGYEPGYNGGKPVPVEIVVPIRFQLAGRYSQPESSKKYFIKNDSLTFRNPYDAGSYAMTVKEYELAVKLFNEYLKSYWYSSKQRAQAYYNIAVAHLYLGDDEKAISTLTTALEDAGSWFANGYLTRADVYYKHGDYQMAKDDYHAAVTIQKQHRDGLVGRGNCNYALGLYENAKKDFKKVVRLYPKDSEAHQKLGAISLQLKEFEDCTKHSTQAILLSNENALAYHQRGMCYARMRDMEKACEDWYKAKELGVKDAELLVQNQCSEETQD